LVCHEEDGGAEEPKTRARGGAAKHYMIPTV
jgi:hypothetical protein